MAAEACLRGGRWQQGEPAVTELDVIWSYPLGSAQVCDKVRGQYKPPPAESARLGLCMLGGFCLRSQRRRKSVYFFLLAYVCQCLH